MLLLLVVRLNLSALKYVVVLMSFGGFPSDASPTYDMLLISHELGLHYAYNGSFVSSVTMQSKLVQSDLLLYLKT